MPRDLVVDAAGSGKRPRVANAMKAGMHILRPLLAETGTSKTSKMLIGTVKGDIYDMARTWSR